MLLTTSSIKDYVITELGFPVVAVELDDRNIIQATADALRMFNRYMCDTQLRVAWDQGGASYEDSEETGSQEGSVTIQLEEGVRGVCEVKFLFPESQRSYARINIFEILYRMVFPRFPVSDWYFFRTYYEMFQRVRGTEPGWRYDEFTRKLYIDCWGGPFDIFYVVSKNIDLDSFNIGKFQHEQEFLDLIMARCKMMLARLLGKWGTTIPAPGGPVATDAIELRNEGKEDEKRIKEWLVKYSRQMGPIMTMG